MSLKVKSTRIPDQRSREHEENNRFEKGLGSSRYYLCGFDCFHDMVVE